MDVTAYRMMMKEDFHPVWKDLALRRIKKGDSIASVLAKHRPWRREDFSPYTALYYEPPLYSLTILAKDGVLISAEAGSRCWHHVFFTTPEEEDGVSRTYTEHVKRERVKTHAYRIHRAVTCGQDVFISGRVKRTEIPYDLPEEQAEQYREVYGADFVPTRLRLTAEVTKVLHGDLKPGTTLEFPGTNCGGVDPNAPETIFLHFDDAQMLYSHSPFWSPGELYLTVRREALEWYQSLSPEQVREFETRCERELAESLARTKTPDPASDRER
jgi:hypothetical protein